MTDTIPDGLGVGTDVVRGIFELDESGTCHYRCGDEVEDVERVGDVREEITLLAHWLLDGWVELFRPHIDLIAEEI